MDNGHMTSSHAQPRRRWWWPWHRRRSETSPTDVSPETTTGPVISVHGLTKVYGHGDSQIVALDHVDLEVARATFTAVMGPSGSGKSTLMHALAGLDSATSGSVALEGRELTSLDDRSLTEVRRDRVGFVFQSFNLVPTLTARQNILLPSSIAGRRVPQERLDRVINAVGLRDRLDHRPSELSGGQQQRVALARALVTEPAVIFADEPTGNLDSTSTAEVLTLLRQAVDDLGQTVVMVTHEPDAAAWADRALFLVDGRIVADLGAPTRETILTALAARPRGSAPATSDSVSSLLATTGAAPEPAAKTRVLLPSRRGLHDSDGNPLTQEIALLAVERVRAINEAAARSAAAPDALRDELGTRTLATGTGPTTPADLPSDSAEVVIRARRILGDLPGSIVPDEDD